MARYTGPKWRINRREGITVIGDDGWKKRATAPGQHGAARGKRPSNYAIQFREKQKVKRTYGLLEKQFRRFYALASKYSGNTGTRLLQLLELRLDSVVYRLKLAKTRNQARQYVTHGHVLVNGNKIDIPSYIVKTGDRIELDKDIASLETTKLTAHDRRAEAVPKWLSADTGSVIAEPLRTDIDSGIKEQLIIELYSRYNIK